MVSWLGSTLPQSPLRNLTLFDSRVFLSFWLLGLINNVLYVIILSAALDLVGHSVGAGTVLLVDVFPSFLTKLIAPYFIQSVPYGARVVAFVCISAAGMLLIALTPSSSSTTQQPGIGHVALKFLGIALASLSSGGGELSFLALTHFYGDLSLAAWGSGTGGAGLVGAGAYAVATNGLGLQARSALLAFAFLPVVMLVGFFVVLPRTGPLLVREGRYRVVQTSEGEGDREERDDGGEDDEAGGLLGRGHSRMVQESSKMSGFSLSTLTSHIRRARKLFFPYMLPLLLVYIAEYTINQGVAPTLLFPLPTTPFHEYRAFYPTYNAIYQLGVFLSRSSTPFLRIHNLYLPSFLQLVNLALLSLHALFNFLPSVWLVFGVVFWEGLLGGLVYVNTFAEIRDSVPAQEREFSLSATTVSDSAGICIAALVSIPLARGLCAWQVDRGRAWCREL